MVKILKVKYDDETYWYSSKFKLKEMLIDSLELFIIYVNESKKISLCLLKDLQGKRVFIDNEIIEIPED